MTPHLTQQLSLDFELDERTMAKALKSSFDFELDERTLAKPPKSSSDFELDERTLAKSLKLSSELELDECRHMTKKCLAYLSGYSNNQKYVTYLVASQVLE